MTITNITVYCDTNSMGDNVTEADADGYRAWLTSELEREFPGADVAVLDEQATNTVQTDADADDYAALERLQYFVEAAWDRCGREWVQA